MTQLKTGAKLDARRRFFYLWFGGG